MKSPLADYQFLDFSPRRMLLTAWGEHIPFSFFLIGLLRPSIFVELGVHTGVSFSAFCQSAREQNVPVKCYGVDTFEGEKHAGHYDDSVYNELLSYIAGEYSDFAHLLRMRFDEAVSRFSDKSIDLLHIDGLHTYEAVKSDFYSWLPKMSETGVVLFHDTMVRHGDFGVWKFWAEIKTSYPSYEFTFCNGLGVLAVGKRSERVISFIDELNADENIAKIFHLAGSRIMLRFDSDNFSQECNRKEAALCTISREYESTVRRLEYIYKKPLWKLVKYFFR